MIVSSVFLFASDNYIAWFLIILGFIFAIYQVAIMIEANTTTNWLFTEGQIEYSVVQGSINPAFDDTNKVSKTYFNQITYSYEIKSEKFFSDRIFIGDKVYSSKDYANNLKIKYKPFQKVKVFYNPKNKKESVLEVGVHNINIVLFFASIGVSTFAIIIL